MKRTERHHLKEDEMAHGVHWAVEFFQKYRREITIVGAALAFAAVVFAGLLAVRANARSRMSRAIGEVGALAAEVSQKPEKLADLEKLAAKGRTARLASLELARYWAEKGRLGQGGILLSTGSRPARRTSSITRPRTSRPRSRSARRISTRPSPSTRRWPTRSPRSIRSTPSCSTSPRAMSSRARPPRRSSSTRRLQADYSQSYYGYEASLKAGKLEVRK